MEPVRDKTMSGNVSWSLVSGNVYQKVIENLRVHQRAGDEFGNFIRRHESQMLFKNWDSIR